MSWVSAVEGRPLSGIPLYNTDTKTTYYPSDYSYSGTSIPRPILVGSLYYKGPLVLYMLGSNKVAFIGR